MTKMANRISAKEAKTLANKYWGDATHPEKHEIVDTFFKQIEELSKRGKFSASLTYQRPKHLNTKQVNDLLIQVENDLLLAGFRVEKHIEYNNEFKAYDKTISSFTLYVDWKVE